MNKLFRLEDANCWYKKTQKLNGHSWKCILIMPANKPPLFVGSALAIWRQRENKKQLIIFTQPRFCLDNERKYTKRIALIHKTTIPRCGSGSYSCLLKPLNRLLEIMCWIFMLSSRGHYRMCSLPAYKYFWSASIGFHSRWFRHQKFDNLQQTFQIKVHLPSPELFRNKLRLWIYIFLLIVHCLSEASLIVLPSVQ